MVVGVLKLSLFIGESNSLKAKRQVIKKIVDRVKNKFALSVSEVGSNDLWQRADLAVSAVSSDEVVVRNLLNSVEDFVEGLYVAEISESSIECSYL